MVSPYARTQHIYVGSFDFIFKRRIKKYGYVSSFNYNTQKYIVTCRCIDKLENPNNNHPNLEFEYEPYTGDGDDDDYYYDIQITKFLG